MKTKNKNLALLLAAFVMLSLVTVSIPVSAASFTIPDFSGSWEFTFYDEAGNFQGKKTIEIGEDGSISGKVILSIDNVIYNTEVSASLSAAGRINDGTLTDTDKLEMVGALTGSFTDTEGKGKWRNYYGKSGSWEAKRSEKKR
jgi:hypothetical protein